MILIAAVPAIVMLIGAFVYGFASNPKLAELGRLTFLAGVTLLTYVLATKVVHVP